MNHDHDPGLAWDWMLHGRYLGFTLTFTHRITAEDLLRRYDADPAAARYLPFAGIDHALQPDLHHAIIRVGQLNDWAFGLEILGIQGQAPATLANLSRDTQTISVHRGANALHMLTVWQDGQPRESFELGVASSLHAAGPHPFWDATERHRTAKPGTDALRAALQTVEDHIGAHLTKDVDDGPLLSVLLPQILPPLPSPVPPLPPVNRPPHQGLGRDLGTIQIPDSPPPSRGLRVPGPTQLRPVSGGWRLHI